MSWPYSRSDRLTIPPMGQGLAIIVTMTGIGIVTIGAILGYLFSLHIAAVNMRTQSVDARIRSAREQVRALRQEFDFRSRFVELERWHGALGLQPVEPDQYVTSLHQLAPLAAARRDRFDFERSHPCVATLADSGAGSGDATCTAGPGTGRKGYAPEARQQLDQMIGSLVQ